YSSERFIRYAAQYLGTGEDKKAIEDILETRERAQDEERRLALHARRAMAEHEIAELRAERDRLLDRQQQLGDWADGGHVQDGVFNAEMERLREQLIVINSELRIRGEILQGIQEGRVRGYALLDPSLPRRSVGVTPGSKSIGTKK